MRLALGPPQYFWPRERTLAFYREALTWPLDVVYLGETVCSKRRGLRLADWLQIGTEFAQVGEEVVLSTRPARLGAVLWKGRIFGWGRGRFRFLIRTSR